MVNIRRAANVHGRMKLRDYQQAAVSGAYKLFNAGKRRVIITMATGCHARGQGILMYDGSVRAVETIDVGDLLMGPDSTPRTVLSLARGRQEMRRIVPETGRSWAVNLDHVLTLANGGDDLGLRDPSSWLDITVREYLREQRREWHPLSLIRETPHGRTLVPFWTEKMPEDDYFGFELDGDHRYLLDDFTVTHNSGKSLIFKKMAHDAASRSSRVLLLVEGQDLVEQAANHMRVAGLRVGVEMADQRIDTRGDLLDAGPQVVVASIDSMVRRVKSYPADYFGLVITDECFPAGAMVDGRPIETIKVGDMVRSWNADKCVVEMRPVVRLFKNPAPRLIRLWLSDHTCITSTPEHPFATDWSFGAQRRGYTPAKDCMGARFVVTRDDGRGPECFIGPWVIGITDDDNPTENCPDGHVYNFEVEGNHNYFVNDILVHNCHHAMAPSYRRTFGHFGFPVPREPEDGGGKYPDIGTCKLVGLTATPDRTDKKALVPDIFEEVAFEYPIIRAIEDGWLVPVKQVLCHLPGYDISKVRTVAGELNAADLAEVLEPLVTPMVQDIVKTAGGKRTLVYSVLKKLAVATTDALRKEGAGNVCTIVGETPRSSNAVADPDSEDPEKRWPDRERMFEAFRRGDLSYLSSVATLIEGVDLPEAEVAAVLRPTKSGLVYTQIAGRVFRPLPGIVDGLATAEERRAAIAASAKPCCYILDFAGNAGRHKLVRVLDLFADDLTEAQRKAADKLIESGECEDVLEAIARAREIIAEMERERAGRGVEKTAVDPFDVLAIPYRRDEFDRPATDGQLATLLRHGAVKGNPEKDREKMLAALREKFDRTSASLFIDVVVKRTAAHQSTIKQAMLLVSKGIPADVAKSMSFARASAAMTELATMNWRPSPGWIEKYRQPEREVAA